MKATGIVRKVDELGRVVLPKELRDTFNIEIRDSLEIYVDQEKIILKKYEPACIFCGNAGDVIRYKGKLLCSDCLTEIRLHFTNQRDVG
ncbi:AbrB/MazE/SpoVT family DNA-binding domain-containing protein [Brevibacillus marinus]|uniref:AbrB/MazE/SpoVT family DNA-binding domain-containing protein n=1 Tax=Brevibacillus marinus TaxID=2496837 RepID=UPI000F845423|nr:AbrB/MazE/SpoVT family DNA-binding domain-containing protein [Brevibacillus marinus]